MKALSVLIFAALIIFSSCSKDKLPVSDSSTISSAKGSSTVEDNPNGGGGDNIAASTVPVAVKNTFTKLYPDASRIQWKLKNGNYKVEFFRGAIKWQAIISPSGVLLKQERA
jgi:hypothetical protein